MSFSLRNFIKTGLLDAVGKQADYWVILNAAGWMDKGVLTTEDLAEIQAAIDAKNTPPDMMEETPVEAGEASETEEPVTAEPAEEEPEPEEPTA